MYKAIMLNTYEVPQKWHKINTNAISKYFNSFGIDFEVMDLNHPLVDNFIKIEKALKIPEDKILNWKGQPAFQPALRKMARFYRCLESNHQGYIFIDIDTIVLKPKQNILDLYQEGLNYAAHTPKDKDINPWTFYTHKFIEFAYGATDHGFQDKFLHMDSGFTIFTKDFCSGFVEYLEKNNFCPINLESLQNLIDISSKTIDYMGGETRHFHSRNHLHDEHVLGLFLNSKEFTYRQSLRGVCGMCSTLYDHTRYSKLSAKEIISAARKKDCIFNHFLGFYTDEKLNEISELVLENEK